MLFVLMCPYSTSRIRQLYGHIRDLWQFVQKTCENSGFIKETIRINKFKSIYQIFLKDVQIIL